MSNKCHHQRATWLEKQKGATAKQITENFLQVSVSISLFLAGLGLCCFSGFSLVAVYGLLTVGVFSC